MKHTIKLFAGVIAFCVIGLSGHAAAAAPNYTAMGDSYSSGVGADVYKSPVGINAGNINMSTYEPATVTNQCFRNNNAYPRQVAAAKGYELAFVACSGATISDILNGKNGEAPQVNALTTSTQLVTLTAGGNDAGFIDIMTCAITSDCSATNPAVVNTNTIIANELPARYDNLFNVIKSKAPNAKIVIAGYSTVLPNMWYQDPYMTPTEKQIALTLRDGLNSAIAAAAARNGVTYVDPFQAGSPFNRVDASAGNLFTPSATWAIRAEFQFPNFWSSYHPTRKGHDYMKQLILPVI